MENKVTVESKPRLKATPCVLEPELSIGVSEKGGISVYGLQRFPVTLYFEQWDRLLNIADEIRELAATNSSLLASKPNGATKGKPEDGYTVSKADLEFAVTQSALATAAGDMPTAVKYATIKAVGDQTGKLSPQDLLFLLTARANAR